MANPSAAHEPSMEEILASIRQIISEDGDKASPQDAVPAAADAAETAQARRQSTEREPYETVVSHFDPEPERQAEAAEAPAAKPEAPRRVDPAQSVKASQQSARPQPPALRQAEAPQSPLLLSPDKGAAISGSFGALAQTILAQNSRTLEDVVAEMLQPMLKSWLDDNLPSLVERLVKDEIERVSRGRR